MTSLGRKSIAGSAWVGASVAVAAIVQLVQLAFVARLLTPDEVGLVAATLIVLALADTISTMGVSNSIVQRQDATRSELISLYWLNLIVGGLVGALTVIFAPALAWLFQAAALVPLIYVVAVNFLLTPHGQVSKGVLERRMDFRLVAVGEIAASMAMLVTSIVLLLSLKSPIAIPIAYCVAAATRSTYFMFSARSHFLPGLHFSLRETRRFLSFGILQSLDTLVAFIAANAGSFAIARSVSTAALGGYNLASTYAVNTPARLNAVVTRVAFPAISQLAADKGRRSRAIRRIIDTVVVVNAPILLTLWIVAPDFVREVFGDEWLWTADLVRVLSIVGITRAMGNPMGAIMMALDRMGLGLVINVVKSLITISAAVVAGAVWGVMGVAYSSLTIGVLGIMLNFLLLRRLANISFPEAAADHLRPLGLCAPMFIVGVLADMILGFFDFVPWAKLVLIPLFSLLAYIMTLRLARHPLLADISAFLRGGR